MIKTFDMIVFFNGYERSYYNISRTAVKYLINWFQENPEFLGYHVDDLFDIEDQAQFT